MIQGRLLARHRTEPAPNEQALPQAVMISSVQEEPWQ